MAPTETLAEQHFATIQSLMPGEAMPAGALDRLDAGPPPGRPARQAVQRRAVADRRHARADRGRGAVRPARRRRRRRAAPLRRPPARRARRQGAPRQRAPRAAHDRHAHPADARPAAVRRPRLHRPARAAPWPPPDQHVRLLNRRDRARACLRPHPRGAARRAPGVRRLPAGRGVGGCSRPARPPPSTSGCATGELARLSGRADARAAAPGEKQAAMARVRRGRGRRARRHLGDRGRDRRPQRHRDAGRGRGPLRDLPAAPAARADRARRARLAVPAVRRQGVRRGCAPWPRTPTASRLAEIDLALRGEGELVGTRQHGGRSSGSPSCRATRSCSSGLAAGPSGSPARTRRSESPSTRCWRDALARAYGTEARAPIRA